MSYLHQAALFPQRSFSSAIKSQLWRIGVLVVLVACLYYPILSGLMQQWWDDPNFSHAFFVPVFSTFLLWRDRSRLAEVAAQPSAWGLLILIVAMIVLIVGTLGAELFLSRVSLLLLIAGLIVFFLGWRYFRTVLFPWAFLFLMIPIPAILFNQLTFPLQMIASRAAAMLLPLLGVPVLREGNIIHIPAMSLEVAEACSGVRSLFSLLTLAVMYGYLSEARKSIHLLLAVAAVPVAVLANSLRIVGTGMLAQYWAPARAEGFFHAFSGWLTFLVSLASLCFLHGCLRRWVRVREVSA